nr:uncharacterized protein LOC127320796 [Lolium perenne]
MAPPLHCVPHRAEGTIGCASTFSISQYLESPRGLPNRHQIRHSLAPAAAVRGRFRRRSSVSGHTEVTTDFLVLFDGGLPATSIKRRRLHFDRADEASTTPNSALPGGACNVGARDASPR